jgi:hypothetical protein
LQPGEVGLRKSAFARREPAWFCLLHVLDGIAQFSDLAVAEVDLCQLHDAKFAVA